MEATHAAASTTRIACPDCGHYHGEIVCQRIVEAGKPLCGCTRAYDDEHALRARLAKLKVRGARIELAGPGAAAGTVRRLARAAYSLVDPADSERARFGTLAQITEDALHFARYGTLPPASSPRW